MTATMQAGLRAAKRCSLPCQRAFGKQRRAHGRAVKEDKYEGTGTNVGEYCSIDASGKRLEDLSLMEKENAFLEV